MVMNYHLKDGHGLAIDHNVEHGVPQQIRQHIQQVHLHKIMLLIGCTTNMYNRYV